MSEMKSVGIGLDDSKIRSEFEKSDY